MIVVDKEKMNEAIVSNVFITVIAGVLVFIASQWITYWIIKPHQAYLEAAGALSCEMLQVTAKYTNFQLDETDVLRIRRANAEYLSAVWNSGFPLRAKRRESGFEVAQNINMITALSRLDDIKIDKVSELKKAMDNIQKSDPHIKIRYDK